MRLSIFEKLYYTGLWLLSNKLAMSGGDSLIVDLPTKVPDYEYEVLARSFLPYILEYFSKEENKNSELTIEFVASGNYISSFELEYDYTNIKK